MCCPAGGICCCTLSVFGILVLVTMGWMVGSGDPYVGGHHLVATAEVTPPACAPPRSLLCQKMTATNRDPCSQDRAKRASACYTAAGIYIVTLGLSAVCYFRECLSALTASAPVSHMPCAA